MAYILSSDLKRLIQSQNLLQISGSDSNVVDEMIATAESEVKSYLVQKYLIADEFRAWKDYAWPGTFYPGDRIILTAPAYNANESYTQGTYTLYQSNVYSCLNPTSGPFDPNDWLLTGPQNKKYYAIIPSDTTDFDYRKLYAVGDKVFWLGKSYTAQKASQPISSQEALQYVRYENLPYLNVFPNDPDNGVIYWGAGTTLTYTDKVITNTAYFAAGDNRNQEIVNYVVDIALYHLHSRIAPRNIPDLRVKRYDDAISKLKNYARGNDVTLDLPVIQSKSGSRVRWGSDVRQNNTY